MSRHGSATVDTDVHIRWKDDKSLLSRLPRSWHDRWISGAGHTQAGLRILPKYYNPRDVSDCSSGKTVGSQAVASPASLIDEWLVPRKIDGAILSVFDAPNISTFADIDYPVEIARAVNAWMAEEWLDVHPGLFGSIVVATQDPPAAAREILRAAGHPKMVQVMLPNGASLPYGHRFYYPIYAAAEECGLALAIHAGTEGSGTAGPPTPCGWPSTFAELRVARSTAFLAHLTSLVTEGVFTRFPALKVMGFETGVSWLPAYLWRFDKNYKALRSECPYLQELPSTCVKRHFRFGTQGVEHGTSMSSFWQMLNSVDLTECLMFSSNYPRWDCEEPERSPVLSSVSEELLSLVSANTAILSYPRLRSSHVGDFLRPSSSFVHFE